RRFRCLRYPHLCPRRRCHRCRYCPPRYRPRRRPRRPGIQFSREPGKQRSVPEYCNPPAKKPDMHCLRQKETLETERVERLIEEPRPPIKMTIFCPWFSKKKRASSSGPFLSVDSIVCQREFQLIAFCVAAGGRKLDVAASKRRRIR